MKQAMTQNAAGRSIQDLYRSSNAIFISMVMSIVYCILFIYLMSAFAEQIAWGIVVITQIGLFAGSAVCFFEYMETKGQNSATSAEKSKGFLIGGIVLLLSAFIMLCMIVCGFN
jgi:F0F1-type ATP synthase assembly protein I